MATMKLLTVLVFGIVLSGNANAQQDKCRQEFKTDGDFAQRMYDFVVAYNISSSKNVQSCVDFLEDYKGEINDSFSLAYTEAGVKYVRPGIMSFVNKRLIMSFNDNPNEVYDVNAEPTPSGVYVSYVCKGDNQFIWISYDNVKDLSKEADDVAKGFTGNPADYKIARVGC